jgi:hypothetical protein
MGQARGTAGHAALAVWHVDYDPQKAMQAAWDNWSNAGYQDNEDWQLLEAALNRYFIWSKANDRFILKVAEQKFEIEYQVYEDPRTNDIPKPVVFTGFMDGIVEEDGFLWILENKFLKKMDNSDSTMDPQVSSYMLAAHTLGYDVKGVIYNKVRVADTKVAISEPVVRTRQYRNPAGLAKVEQEMIQQVKAMMAYAKGGVPYRSITKDCSWDCSFFSACGSMSDDGVEPTEILKMVCNIRSNENAE